MTDEDVNQVEYELNLDEMPKQEHNWVQRGLVISCEGARHPNHRHFLTKRSKPMVKN